MLLPAACAAPPPPGPAATAPPAWGSAFLATGGEAFVPDPRSGRVWLGVISQALPYDQAQWYCRRLPPHDAGPWRVPELAELTGAPFDRYHLPEERVRLWTATPVPGEEYRRWVVDPRTGLKEPKEVRQGVRLRVLCVTGAGR